MSYKQHIEVTFDKQSHYDTRLVRFSRMNPNKTTVEYSQKKKKIVN